jgi:exodeoxyribonuclease VII large subunit
MSESVNTRKIFSLLEVAQSIGKTLSGRYSSAFWIKAEINKLNFYALSGHCYPELVEKRDGKVIAQMKSNLWNSDLLRINEQFLQTLKEPLKDGIQVLMLATIQFDALYGLSLRIIDIDPSYSLGELERERLATIERLKQEGIFDANRWTPFPVLPQRIAIISVETSKGYSDFLNMLAHNSWGYRFFHYMFPALLQGDRSVPSIIAQLHRIRKVLKHFDVVAIIRGGGGDVGLSSYNSYELCREVAQFPIPVITGIGHSTNETVTEMVAYRNAITPTELADFLLQAFHNFSVPVQNAEKSIAGLARNILLDSQQEFVNAIRHFRSATASNLRHHRATLSELSTNVKRNSATFLTRQKTDVASLEKNVNLLDPLNVLKRGFTITYRNGKIVKGIDDVQAGDSLTTQMADGEVNSTVVSSKLNS